MKDYADGDMIESSGNVFADLELEDPEEMLARAEIARMLSEIIEARQLSQAEAANLLGSNQEEIAMLVHGRLDAFSLDRLLRHLRVLDRDIEIVIRAKSDESSLGRVSVITR